MDAFFVIVEQAQAHLQGIVQMHLAEIFDVRFGGIGGAAGALEVDFAEPPGFKKVVHTAIEQDVIVSHVEVAVKVDPLRFHGLNRCKIVHFGSLFVR